MKKLFVVLLIAIFILALAACGGETASTTKGADTTTPAVTTPMTTTAAEITTTAPTTTQVKTPETTLPGIDILYGHELDSVIDPDWKKGHSIALENHHSSLDYHWALVIKLPGKAPEVYSDLVWTVGNEDESTIVVNQDYRWVVTFERQTIEIERFSVYDNAPGCYIRMDLGESFTLPDDPDEDGYDVWLHIYDKKSEDVVYYAWFTDPRYDDLYQYTPVYWG